jgi:hypothetical protein
MNDLKQEFYIWLRDDDENMSWCYAPYILKVYGEDYRDLVWDLFKEGFAREFFEFEKIQKEFDNFAYYFIYKMQEEYNIDLEIIDMDVLSFEMPLKKG